MRSSRVLSRLVVVAATAAGVTAATLPAAADAALELTRIARFTDPVTTVAAPGRSSRGLLFVAERRGVVRVVRGGKPEEHPFLDISDRVNSTELEQGLLSIAFDPRYEQNGRFYAYYTGADGSITISRFLRSRNDRLRADPDTAEPVLVIPHTDSRNHNGGQIAFGPDGNLWISTGDGHPGCDPPENAQNPDVLLGKLLRITPVAGGYEVPPDNPYVGVPGADEVYASGLRNPFRFSIDRRDGTIAIGDVGQFHWEEVDFLTLAAARGANFGWDAFEARSRSSSRDRVPTTSPPIPRPSRLSP